MAVSLGLRIYLNYLDGGKVGPMDIPQSLGDCFHLNDTGLPIGVNEHKLRLYYLARAREREEARPVPRRPKVQRDYHACSWWMLYFADDSYITDSAKVKVWRNRFRLPYLAVKEFVRESREMRWFADDGFENRDAIGALGPPLELLVCVALRYMGRHHVLDDFYESTFISSSTAHRFILLFWRVVRQHLYPRHVIFPTTVEQLKSAAAEFTHLGLPGCIGCIDCTHIECFSPAGLRNSNVGKEGFPTRGYILGATPKRKILYTLPGKPGTWSDCMHANFDEYIQKAKDNIVWRDFEWTAKNANGVDQTFSGPWFLVDGGFMSWLCLMCGYKNTTDKPSWRWSKWCESVRKCVECVFGILKKRWQILKTGFRMRTRAAMDDCWFSCCALHNWIFELLEEQEKIEDVDDDDGDLPQGVRNVLGGPQSVEEHDDAKPMDIDEGFAERRQILITHWDYLWRKEQLRWRTQNVASGSQLEESFEI